MKPSVNLAIAAFGMSGLAAPALAQQERTTPMLDQGTREISIAGRIELPGLDRVDYDLDGSFGYFLRDGWEVGARIGASDFGGADRVDIGGFTEWNFRRESDLVPYIGAGIALATVSLDDGLGLSTELDDDGFVFDMEAGVKYFVRPYMAITAGIDFQFSPDDIFATDDSIEDNLTSLNLGMRYYF